MTLSLALTPAKLTHRHFRCVLAFCVCGPVFIHENEYRFYVYVCVHMLVFMHNGVLGCAFWLESKARLRWAMADILVCFNPLANKAAGNHQKNTSSWTGRTAWGEGGRGEERTGRKECEKEGSRGTDWAHGRWKKFAVCVFMSQHGGSGCGRCCFCGVSPATPDNLHLSLPY